MAERSINFRVGADVMPAVTAMDRLTKSLQEVNAKAEATGGKFEGVDKSAEKLAAKLGIDLTGSSAKAVAAFQALYDHLVAVGAPAADIERAFKGLSDAQSKYASLAGTGFWEQHKASILAAGSAIVAFGVSAVQAFIDSEAHTIQLEAALKATGSAVGLTKDQMLGLADALSHETVFTKGAIKEAEAMLLIFGNLGKNEFPRALKITLDLATAMGIDAASAAKMLGKAMEDPVNGLTALRRASVMFSAEQKNVLKYLIDTGQAATAQKMILDELSAALGDRAAAAARSLGGQLTQLEKNFHEAQVEIGEQFAPVIKSLIQEFPNLSMVAVAAGKGLGGLNVSTGDLLIAIPLLKTAFSGMGIAMAATLGTVGLWITAGAALVGIIGSLVWAMKAELEQAKNLDLADQAAIKATTGLTSKAHEYGIEIARGKETQEQYNAKLFAAIANYEKLNGLLPKTTKVTRDLNAEMKAHADAVKQAEAVSKAWAQVINQDIVEGLNAMDAEIKRLRINELVTGFQGLNDKSIELGAGLKDAADRTNELHLGFIQLSEVLPAIPPFVLDIEAAFKTLGITTDEQMSNLVDEAFAAYKSIADDGTRSAREVDLAWAKALQSQIDMAKKMGQQVPAEYQKEVDKIKGTYDQLSTHAKKTSEGIGADLGNILNKIPDVLANALSNALVGVGSFGDNLVKAFQRIGAQVAEVFIKYGIQVILGSLGSIGTALGGIIGGLGGGGGAGGGGTGAGGLNLPSWLTDIIGPAALGGIGGVTLGKIAGISGMGQSIAGIGGGIAGGLAGVLGLGSWAGPIGLGVAGAIAGLWYVFTHNKGKVEDTKLAEAEWPKIWAAANAYKNAPAAPTEAQEDMAHQAMTGVVGQMWNFMATNFQRKESITDQGKYMVDVYKLIDWVYSEHLKTIQAMGAVVTGTTVGSRENPTVVDPGRTHFASGGIVTRPTLALIGEAGPEAVIPLNGANRMGNVYVRFEKGSVVTNDPKKLIDEMDRAIRTNRAGARTRLNLALAGQ
jgi:hypothetical protein